MPAENDDLEVATTIGDTEVEVEVEAPPQESADLLHRGTTLGKYMIIELIGSGGMGIVYSAYDPQLDRKVALKVLRKKWDMSAKLRLQREAKAMAKLSHPNVVSVYEVSSDGDHDFVAMELVDGQDIESWCKEGHPPYEILSVYIQAGQGLNAAHEAGLVHRDFKPTNVLISQTGRVLVTDFGLARQDSSAENELLAESPSDQSLDDLDKDSLTRTGLVLGTPAYMAPEQHRARLVDARSDQFSFCVSLFHSLSGERPYLAETYADLKKQVTRAKARPLPDHVKVSESVREALATGLSRAPADRFSAMPQLLEKLNAPLVVRQRRWKTVAVIAFGLVVFVGLLFFVSLEGGQEQDSCEPDPKMLKGSWDPHVRSGLHQAFIDTGVTQAENTFSSFASNLDSYAADLVAMRREICEDNRGPVKIGDGQMVLQMACLQKRRQELTAITKAFMGVEERSLSRAVEASMGLPHVSACRNLTALKRGVIPPPDSLRSEVEALRATLQEANSLYQIGQRQVSVAMAEAVRDKSVDLGYKPLRAEAHFTVGSLLLKQTHMTKASESLEEAVLVAEECEHAEVRARALVALAKLYGGGSSKFEKARRYSRQARAAIDHWGGDDLLELKLAMSLAYFKIQEGKPKDAMVILKNVTRTAKSTNAISEANLVVPTRQIAQLHMKSGEFTAANRLAIQNHKTIQDALGDDHPRTITLLAELAQTHRALGELDVAHRMDARLREFWAGETGRLFLRDRPNYRLEGRSASGRVTDGKGNPVGGATVACGHRVFADSKYIDASWDPFKDAFHHFQATTSAADGSFACEDTTSRALVLVADHPEQGRSFASEHEESEESVTGVHLKLHPTGGLSGRVQGVSLRKGIQHVVAIPSGTTKYDPSHSVSTYLRKGRYQFEKLAPGDYQVVVGSSIGGDFSVHSEDVRIISGETLNHDFNERPGSARYRFKALGEHGAPLNTVQLMIMKGHHSVSTGAEFGERVYAKGVEFRSHFLVDHQSLEVNDLTPGLHTVCLVPILGDYRDPEYLKTVTREVQNKLHFFCHDVELEADSVFEDRTKVPPAIRR